MARIIVAALVFLLLSPALADQTVIPNYDKARKDFFWTQLYPTGGSTLYCDQPFEGHFTLEIEHVYPASWMGEHLQCGNRTQCRQHAVHGQRFNHMEADLHNLYPAMAGMNGARSNHKFGIIDGEKRSLVNCDFEVDRDAKLAEPRPGARGDIARAIFYMHHEYGLPIAADMKDTLKQWHEADPPSTHEIWRNDTIDRLQGTRNPYVDDPALASSL